MPDYKKMYLQMVHASEQAINILIAAQRECEELYISTPEPTLTILRAYPKITGVPIAPPNFVPDEGNLTRHTWCMVRKIDEVWREICKQAVRR